LLLKGIAGDLTGEQRRQVEMVQRASDRLSSFASALMEAQQAESLHTPAADEFDIVSLVESVVIGLDSFADDKGLALEFSAQESAVTVRSDRYKVQQILLNLLSNAIRYTQSGSVTATVNSCAEGFVTIVVSDTGVGIAPASLASLFDVPETATGKAGIGLPASMQIARALGGSIEVESTPGAGSTFSLKLPCTESEQEKDRANE
ncbi:HAMP domain-containing histidine kinase, partial [bacterium]|nr:HAMP domain-containing histidine kinase [bacterium]